MKKSFRIRTLLLVCILLFSFRLPVAASGETTANGVDYEAVYNYDFYINQYADLKAAFVGNPAAAFRHFLTNGMREGRQASAEFNVQLYRQRYADLERTFGDNLPAYYLHYILCGKAERRNAAGTVAAAKPAQTAANTQKQQTSASAFPVIVLDPGHGGTDPGCVRGKTYEKNITFAVVLEAARILQERGFAVRLTRDSDYRIVLADRVAISNSYENAAFVAVHVNTLPYNNRYSGMEIFCNGESHPESPRLARNVLAYTTGATGARTSKAVTDSFFHVLKNNSHPACLIEIGFLSSNTEYPLLVSDSYQKLVAGGIADGITAFLAGQ
ncbi:MAG: N-acetylmuramoyl-L-alanine amidase [Lachnospiraceae bacterium]|nr:N-acetylmuramoyl-L-alanine amidase [Lachnospiraceae bacterium]